MTKKGVKLIAPDKNGTLCYQGDCKVIIDPIYKVLQIHPKNFEEYYNISVLFEKKFIQKKNLLFIFGDKNFQDFVLVFKNEELCKRVHDIIYKHKTEEEDFIQEDAFQQRLLIPIFQILPQKYSTRFKRVIIDWIEKHEENEKIELMKLYKKQKRNIQMMDIKNIKKETSVINVRKRRFSEIENNNNVASYEEQNNDSRMVDLNIVKCEENSDNVQPKKKKEDSPTIIDESMFKIVSVKKETGFYRKLLIFTSEDKTQCYEYNFYSSKQFYYHRCHSKSNGMKAILALDESGNEFVKHEKKKHRCSPLQYDPKKYDEIKIFKKPDYEMLDNCSTRTKKILIIFYPNDKSQCYEYYWSSFNKKFLCCGCAIQKKTIFAEIFHENTEAEYILISNNEHICKTRNYDPKKYFESNNFVLSPNFEIQANIKDGIQRKTLIIFYGNDRNLCYTYYFATITNIFNCSACSNKGKYVPVRMFKNDDGEDYVILSNAKHVCSPKEYIPPKNEVIIRPPKMKFIESNETCTSRLFIFASNDNKLCYIFSKCPDQNTKRYYCLGCRKLTKTIKGVCMVVLCQNDEGSNGDKYYVKMMDNQKHVCKPQKYEPQKYETKLLMPKDDYVLFQKSSKKICFPDLAIFDSNDKSFCFEFYYYSSRKCFQCYGCLRKNVNITAKIQQDSDGNEYVIINQIKHVCNPIKISSVIKSDTIILERSKLSVELKKKKEIDESRIVRLPKFELQKNTKGVPERKLIVFYGDDNNLCYEYGYDNKFVCKKCKISATLHFDPEKNNEKYIILGPTEHSCEPLKYVAEKKNIGSPNFMIFNQDDDSKLTKLVIFTSSTKKECYEYSFIKKEKLFRCCGCYASKKIVSAKLMKDSNNEEYIQLSKIDHICAPKKFVLEEFQPKIIPENGFKLCSNKNGKENSKLIVFDSDKDGFGYEYLLERNLFICNQCNNKKKRVTAKLCEKENGAKIS